MAVVVKIFGTNWYWSSSHFWQGWGKQIALALLFFFIAYYLTATEIPIEQMQVKSGPIIWSATGR